MNRLTPTLLLLVFTALAGAPALLAQTVESPSAPTTVVAEQPKPSARKRFKLLKKLPTPAKQLFGAANTPAPMAAQAIGFYAKGCLAGGMEMPVDGPAWQAMRLSRNRNWAHPDMVALLKKLATEAQKYDGWPGLLVGDLSQPRGGPMLTGHASHQVGLDADVWFTPMPDRRLTEKEREELSATSMLSDDPTIVNPKTWSEAHVRILKRVASYPQVERVLVHPAIKKAVCEASKDEKNRGWLAKIRPIWGHYYHFHIRIACPKGSGNCEAQPSVGHEDGCGAELKRWLALVKNPPKPGPIRERTPITLAQLPAGCTTVLNGGSPPAVADKKSDEKGKPAQAKRATMAK